MPEKFVSFLGYTIYNAKKYAGQTEWDLATAHYNYAKKIPQTISQYIKEEVRSHLTDNMTDIPIGLTSVMHTHNTLPNMAQKYNHPIWQIPDLTLEKEDISTIKGNHLKYRATKEKYIEFAKDFINRVKTIEND